MSLYGVMVTGASDMAVQADRLGTVADNVANIGTTGYKRASTEFSTLIPQEAVVDYRSGVVETEVRRAIDEQGGFEYTRSVTDLAISGGGFFVVSGPNGQPVLTRAGAFVPDGDGRLVNAAGFSLMGYSLLSGNGSPIVNATGGLEEVRTSSLGLRADPSSEGSLQVNLPATAAPIVAADLPAANAASAQYTAKASLIGYDNLGSEVTFDVYFAKSGTNAWEVSVYDRAAAGANGGFPYAAGPLTSANLAFDGTTGAFTSASRTSLAIPVPNGAVLTLDLAGTSHLATDFAVRAAAVDGSAPAAVDRLEIGSDGTIVAVYENGARVPSYAIPLANVASPNNLTALPGNVFLPSLDSGDIQIGTAGTGALGTIVSGALEQSTVDLATELTTMIAAQRSYTANSKVFQTGAELIDVLVNLRR